MQKIFNMIALATRGHSGIKRKWCLTPAYHPVGWIDDYMVHPLRCWRRYIETTPVRIEDEECGIIGHDTLEDCSKEQCIFQKRPLIYAITEEDIIQASGKGALIIIQGLTFPTSTPEWEGRPRIEKRKVELAHLRELPKNIQRLKLIDRWDNLDGMANPMTPRRMLGKYIPETEDLLDICGDSDHTIAGYIQIELQKCKDFLANGH